MAESTSMVNVVSVAVAVCVWLFRWYIRKTGGQQILAWGNPENEPVPIQSHGRRKLYSTV